MLRNGFFVILMFVSMHSVCQDWPKVYKEPGPGAYARWLIETYDNGYFIIGPKNTYKLSWIIKTDINGDMLWDKKIGNGQYLCILGGIDQTDDGGFVVTGQSNKYDTWGDPVIMKFSTCGEVEWCTVINTPGEGDYARHVRSTSDNCYLMLTLYSDPNPLNRIQLFKFDKTGELIWRQTYPPDSLMFAENSRNLLVDSTYYLISAKCHYPDPGQPGGHERPYFIKTDTAGNVTWRLIYGKENGYHGSPFKSTLISSTGFFYASGVHSNYCDTPALIKFTEEGEEDYFQDLFPGACPAGNSALNFLNDTTLVTMVGGTISGTDVYKWIKTDTLGVEFQSKDYIENWIKLTGLSIISSDKKIVSLSKISDTFYFYKINTDLEYDSIYTMPRMYDSLCPYPIVSDTVDPDCGLIVSIQDPEKDPESFNLKVYPNPARDKITIEIPEYLQKQSGPAGFQATTVYHQWGSAILELYNLFGMKMTEREVIRAEKKVEVDVSDLQAGMYVIRLVFQDQVVANSKFVVE